MCLFFLKQDCISVKQFKEEPEVPCTANRSRLLAVRPEPGPPAWIKMLRSVTIGNKLNHYNYQEKLKQTAHSGTRWEIEIKLKQYI